MAEVENESTAPLEHPFEPLRWIGTYKILKGVLSIVAGLMLLRVMHRGLPDVADRWMATLHIEPQSALGQIILHRIVGIKRASVGWIAVGLFAYTPLTCIEGIGLLLRKVWAEWITLITTAALIPLEIHEIIRRLTGLRVLLLVLNVAVLIYLIVRLRRDRHRRTRHATNNLISAPGRTVDSVQSTDPPPPARQSNVPG
jgi:uncharacterized membrane protein (DUF2068 family)